MRGARILASFVQSTLDAADRADADLGTRLRARLRPATLRAVEDAASIAFLPVALGAGRLVYEGLPPAVVASRPHLIGVEAALGACLELLGVEGEVQLGEVDATRGRVVYQLGWKR